MASITLFQVRQNKAKFSAQANIIENGSAGLGPIVWLNLCAGDETVTIMLPPNRFKEAVQIADLINDLFEPVKILVEAYDHD